MLTSSYLAIFSRTLVGLVLFVAGAVKILDFASFSAAVRGYKIVSDDVVPAVARLVPIAECSVGGLLLAAIALPDNTIRWAAIPATILFLSFGIAVAINLVRGHRNIPCGCFGASDQDRISWALVARNTALCILALLALPPVWRHLPNLHEDIYRRIDAVLAALSVLLVSKLSTVIVLFWRSSKDLVV